MATITIEQIKNFKHVVEGFFNMQIQDLAEVLWTDWGCKEASIIISDGDPVYLSPDELVKILKTLGFDSIKTETEEVISLNDFAKEYRFQEWKLWELLSYHASVK